MLETLKDLVPGFADALGVFDQVFVAEEEIARAKEEWPGKADRLHCAFRALHSPIMEVAPSAMYRVHCRQFLRNLAEGVDLDRPTRPEVAVMVSLGSLHVFPGNELGRFAMTDAETLDAFGGIFKKEIRLVSMPREHEHLWPVVTDWCRKVYRQRVGETRARIYARSLQEAQTAERSSGPSQLSMFDD